MQSQPPSEITILLDRARDGDNSALDELLPIVYDELRKLAKAQRRKRPHDTMNTTALVHEAYIRLAGRSEAAWENRIHFFGVASKSMRDVLVDYARRSRAAKRGGGTPDMRLDDLPPLPEIMDAEILDLHEALEELEKIDPRQARIVELRYFAGMTVEETATILETSPSTVKRNWNLARAWLFRSMREASSGD